MQEKTVNPFIKASMVYIIATIIGQGMTFLGIIVFTRLMSQNDYGRYSTYYAYVSIFSVLIGANLFYALNNAYIDKKREIKQFRRSVLFLSTIIMFLMLIVVYIVGHIILNKISSFAVIMGALHSYGFFLINYRMYSANMENDYRCKQWLLILPYALQFLIALLLICIFPNSTFEARIVGSVLGVGVVACVEYFKMINVKGTLIVLEYWKYALGISIPTIVMSISYMLMQQCDKVMITDFCGAEDTATYSVIYYLGYALIAVDQAVAPVRQAWIFKRLDNKNVVSAKKLQKWYLIIVSSMAMVLLLIGVDIIKIVAPKQYWHYEYIAPFVLSACMMVLYRFYTEIILFYKKNIMLSILVLISAIINIGLNAVLIPWYGAVAACYTTVISYFILFIMTLIMAEKISGKIYSKAYFIIFISFTILISLIYKVIENRAVERYSLLILLLVILGIYTIKNKKEWKVLL